MAADFPPLGLGAPEVAPRKRQRGLLPAVPEAVRTNRARIAEQVLAQLDPISSALHEMSDEERRAVFLKLEHEGPVSLSGTGLKAISEPGRRFTLVVPRDDDLQRLHEKVSQFGSSPLTATGRVPAQQVAYLRGVARGDPRDRLSEELFSQYEDLVAADWVICEIEMISLAQGPAQGRHELRDIRMAMNRLFGFGAHGNIFEHEEIRGTCRAIIRCSGPVFCDLVEGTEWQTRIIWFEERPIFETFSTIAAEFQMENLAPLAAPDDDAPIVCVVDSGVTVGNPFLTPVVRQDLVRSFLNGPHPDPSDGNGHGSAVASLVAYYTLAIAPGAANAARVWVASARVLNDDNECDDRLLSKVVATVVDTFVPLGVRIFNLSLIIRNRNWNAAARRTVPRRSWIARTLDRLSRERDIVFVTCTGNLDSWQVARYIQDGLEYPSYFAEEDSKLLDPSQAALALTTGAVVATTRVVGPSPAGVLGPMHHPAPYTRSGPGMRREVKPELVELGGNYVHDPDGGGVRENPGTSILVATNRLTPAFTTATGTSFAAPRVSHKLALILRELEILVNQPISASLLKAVAVNSALHDGIGEGFEECVQQLDDVQSGCWRNLLGYGVPDPVRATTADAHSVILFYQGDVERDHVALFSLPVPAVLADTGRSLKRLTVTVAFAPEVQRNGLEQYLGTTLRWRLFRGDVPREDVVEAMSLSGDDVGDQADDDEEDEQAGVSEMRGHVGSRLRSRGTVQHDVFEWRQHRREYSAEPYTLAITAQEKWGRANPAPVPYAVVVRLEEFGRSALVYAEVRNVLVRAAVRVRA